MIVVNILKCLLTIDNDDEHLNFVLIGVKNAFTKQVT